MTPEFSYWRVQRAPGPCQFALEIGDFIPIWFTFP